MSQIVQQTIRIPDERNRYIKEKAERIGCSYNSFINVLIDKGLQAYEATPTYVLPALTGYTPSP